MKYKIKQIKDVENCAYACKHYEWAKNVIDLNDYEVVYEGELDYPEMPNALEELFEIFNVESVRRPKDFEGRGMTISDVVEIDGKNYYCDFVGWEELK